VANVVFSIDGEKASCPAGTSILDAALRQGIKIPNLCHHPDLKPYGACRLCLVEDEKTGRLMAACVTPVSSDLVIQTATPRILKHRRNIVRLMIAEHPESCVVCSKGNRCRLRWVAAQLGIGETDLYPLPNYKPLEQANPFIVRDLSKCILCGKCIRADHELVVVGAIDYSHRGFDSRPATAHDVGLEESSCTFCGTCVSMCPTGALAAGTADYVGTPEFEVDTICGFCGVGCTLTMGATGNKIVDVNPAERADSVNSATLCIRGHFAHDFLNSPQRLAEPRMQKAGAKGDNRLVPVSWEAAMAHVAQRLMEIKKENGPQSIAFFGSAKCTNEENYLFQKIARVLVGTHNVDNGGYISGQSLLGKLDEKTGGRYRGNPLSGLEKAEAILILGADPDHSLPVVSYYLKRAAKKNGIPLIVVDPRRTDLVNFASLWLRPRPGTDLELINGLTAHLLEMNGYDREYIDHHTEGFSIFRYSLSTLDPSRVERVTGLEIADLHQAAELLKGKKIAMVVGHGILQQKYGEHSLDALLNLCLMTGSLKGEGSGFFILTRENNQAGAMDMGTVPNRLPGRQALNNSAVRNNWAKHWKTTLSPDAGLNVTRMIEEAEKGTLKALYIMGENPLRALPETARVQKALRGLEFLVVQDILNSETVQLAHVVLPGAAFSEKEGAFTNMEGRIQALTPVVPPPGNARADWEILADLAARLGSPERYDTLEKIRKEIQAFVPLYANVDRQGQGWIDKGAPPADEEASRFVFSPLVSTGDVPEPADYPLTAIIGTLRYHLGSGTRTSMSKRIRGIAMNGEVEISPEDADAYDLKDDHRVRISSPHGTVVRKIRRNSTMRPGELFLPTGFHANDAMDLFSLTSLAGPEAPGWKTCRVRVQKLQETPEEKDG
jgi:formate dehydrogenase alpha subunit